MMDFNDLPTQVTDQSKSILDADMLSRDEIYHALQQRLLMVLKRLLPAGKTRHHHYLVGDVTGQPGDSLDIVLKGPKAGLWTDRATGEGGDIFDLIAATQGLDVNTEFRQVLAVAAQLLGMSPTHMTSQTMEAVPAYDHDQDGDHQAPIQLSAQAKHIVFDELGPATGKWDYLDPAGHLIAVVYRYDPPGGKKVFRPWDVKRRKMTAPEPRPLYNLPQVVVSEQIVLVEGEKSAQALIDQGIVATTAMHGAKAPIDKTDWTPLIGKRVLVWPDRDKPGFDYAVNVSTHLLHLGVIACDILLPPEDKPDGWDAADAIQEGMDVVGWISTASRYAMLPNAMSNNDVAKSSNVQATLAQTSVHISPRTSGSMLGTVAPSSEPSVVGSEDALALAFSAQFAADWQYVAAWGRWLVWTGQRWQHEETLKAQDLIRHVCRMHALNMPEKRVASKLSASSTVSGVERLAKADRRHAATADEWDADPWLLNTPQGVVHLRDGTTHPHDRAYRMTKITRAAACPNNACPTWQAFLQAATNQDKALQAYLARMVGYCLTGVTTEHALFFVYGTGGNGKSVFLNTISSLFGDYATHAPMDTFMETRGERHPTEMAGLRGARLVCATETEQGRRWAESKIKSLTGGDPISARFMRQDFFEFVPQFKLVVAGNHRPSIRNVDEAMKRRLHLIPFTVTIPPEQRDQDLPQKLHEERDGILQWAIEGCLSWQRMGLAPPKSVLDATDEYFESEDALGRWLLERCERRTDATALTFELFTDWKQWAESYGEFVGSQKRFADALLSRRIEKWRNTYGARGFQGIALKAPTPTAKQFLPYADD